MDIDEPTYWILKASAARLNIIENILICVGKFDEMRTILKVLENDPELEPWRMNEIFYDA